MDEGNIGGLWRGVGDDDGDDPLQIPRLGRVQNGVSGSESRFLVAVAWRNSFWQTIEPPRFLGRKATYRRGGRPGVGGAWGACTPPRREKGPPAPGMGVGPPGIHSISYSGSVDLLVN